MAFDFFLPFLSALLCRWVSPWFFLLVPWISLFLWRRYAWRGLALGGLLFGVGFLASLLASQRLSSGKVDVLGVVVKARDNYAVLWSLRGRCYIPWKGNAWEVGDVLRVQGSAKELLVSHYEGSFRFDEYLEGQGVFSQLEEPVVEVLHRTLFRRKAYRGWALSSLGEQSFWGRGLLFFETPSSEEGRGLREAGLLPLIFSTGLHVTPFLKVARERAEGFFGLRKGPLIALPAGFFFAFVSGWGFTGLRIFIASIIWATLSFTKKRMESLDVSSLSFFSVLFLYPGSCREASFVIPFLLSLAHRFFHPVFARLKGMRRLSYSLLLRDGILLPWNLLTTGKISLLSAVFTPFCIPFGKGLFYVALPLYLCPPLGVVYRPFFSFLDGCFSSLNGVGGLALYAKFPPVFFALVLLSGLGFSLFLFLRFSKASKAFLCFGLIAFFLPFGLKLLPRKEVHFIDVGQGLAVLVRNLSSSVLIDTGGSLGRDMAKECLIPYFQKIGVSSLDGVLLTHGDMDHDGALKSLQENFTVGQVLYGRDSADVFSMGEIQFENWNAHPSSGDENSASGVFYFTLGGKSFLVTGDAPQRVELDLLSKGVVKRADVIGVGHHGSKTSSHPSFLKAVDPDLAVISAGEGNWYGHPSQETLKTLEALSIPCRRTDRDGTVVLRPSMLK